MPRRMARRGGDNQNDYAHEEFNRNIWVQNGGPGGIAMKRGYLLKPLRSLGKSKMQVQKFTFKNEKQQIAITGSPTGGTFTLTFGGQTTSAIPYNASKLQVQTALNALSSISGEEGEVECTGGPLPATAIVVEFKEELEETNLPQMTKATSFTGGTSPTMTITTTQQGQPAAWSDDEGEIVKVRDPLGLPDWNEMQQITLVGTPTSGTLKISLQTNQTGNINFDATNLEIQAELEALPLIGSSNVAVTWGPWPINPIKIEFINDLAGDEFPLMTIQTVSGGLSATVIELQRPGTLATGTIVVAVEHSQSKELFAIATKCREDE